MKQVRQLRSQRQHTRRVLPTLAALAAILAAGHCQAVAKYWDTSTITNLQGGNGIWDTGITASWNTNSSTSATGLTTWADNDDARFQVADGAASTVTISGTVQANSLTMGLGRTVVINGGTMQLGPGGLTNLGSAAVLLVNSPVLLAGSQTWTNATGNSTITFGGSVGESIPGSSLTVAGGSGFTLIASNAYTGGTYLRSSALYVSNNCSMGTGLVTLAGGTLQACTNIVLVLSNSFFAAANTTSTVQLISSDLTILGNISGSGVIKRTLNNGTWLNLGGDNSGFSGQFWATYQTRITSTNAGSASARWIQSTWAALRLSNTLGTVRLGTLEGPINNYTLFSEAGTNIVEIGGANLDCTFNGMAYELNTSNPLGLVKVGSGTLSMIGTNNSQCSTNSYYSRGLTIRGGTVNIALLPLSAARCALGAGATTLDGGTLQYTGAGDSSDRKFTLGANGGGLDASGTSALLLTNRTAMLFTNSGPRTLTLTGISTASNVLAVGIGDNGGATSLAKGGSGLWLLTGTNRCTGTLSVTGGTLWVEGSLSNSAAIVVGGTLGGTGTLAGTVTANAAGHLAPGHATGSIKVGGLTLNTGASYDVTIAGTNFTLNGVEQYSRAKIAATGAVALSGGSLNVTLGSYALGLRDKFGIIQNTASSAIAGTFLNLPEGATVLRNNGCSLNITYTGNVTDTAVTGAGTGNDVVLYVAPPSGSAIFVR